MGILFIHSFIHSFIHLFIYLFIYLFIVSKYCRMLVGALLAMGVRLRKDHMGVVQMVYVGVGMKRGVHCKG